MVRYIVDQSTDEAQPPPHPSNACSSRSVSALAQLHEVAAATPAPGRVPGVAGGTNDGS